MTDELKRTVDVLRYCEESGASCGECPSGTDENGVPNCHSQAHIADLIESLSAELEQTKQERGGLSIMLTAAQSAAETYKRERDAAVADILRECHKCKHFKVMFNECTPDYDCEYSDVCEDGDHWQWRGVKEDT